jgi:hypothetical protein
MKKRLAYCWRTRQDLVHPKQDTALAVPMGNAANRVNLLELGASEAAEAATTHGGVESSRNDGAGFRLEMHSLYR